MEDDGSPLCSIPVPVGPFDLDSCLGLPEQTRLKRIKQISVADQLKSNSRKNNQALYGSSFLLQIV